VSTRGFKGAIFDVDGVLVYQGAVCPGAVETIEQLRDGGIVLRFLTNSTLNSRASCARKLERKGFRIDPGEIVTASYAAAAYLRGVSPATCRVLVDGEGIDEFDGFAVDDAHPDYLVVGDNRSMFDFDHLNEAVRLVLSGSKLIGMQSELLDTSLGDIELNVGSWVGMLERAAGVRATYVGKPSEFAFKLVLDTMDLDKRDVVMIGDRASTDVKGAKDFGIAAVLLRSGEFSERELSEGLEPDFIFDSIRDILPLFGGGVP
jgi:NagD protein